MPTPKTPTAPMSLLARVFRWLVERPLVVSLGLATLVVAGTVTVFTPRYETDDDAWMNMIAAGLGFTDAPDPHLIFSNVLVGLVLQHLYRVGGDVPWYGLYLFAAATAALAGICYAFLKAGSFGKQVLFAFLFLVVFCVPCLVHVQFTKIAFLAALAGLLLLLTAAKDHGSLRQIAAAVLLFLLSALIRFESCLLAGMVLSPVLAMAFYRNRGQRAAQRSFLVLAGSLALGFGFQQYNKWYYAQEEGWRDLYEINSLRAQFTDYRRVDYNERTRPVLEAVGWSKIDLAMIYNWNCADPRYFSADKMRTVLEAVDSNDRIGRDKLWREFSADVRTNPDLAPLLALGGICLLFMGGRWWARAIPLLSLATALGVCLVLYQYFHLPRRVYYSALGGCVAIAIASSTGRIHWGAFRPSTVGGSLRLLVLLAAGWLLWGQIKDQYKETLRTNARDVARIKQASAMIHRLAPRPDQLFVLWSDAFPLQNLVLPLKPAEIPTDFKAIGLLWITPAPFTRQRFEQFGIEELYPALYQRPNLFLVTWEGNLRLLAAYLAKHYGVDLAARIAFADPALEGNAVFVLADLRRTSNPSRTRTEGRRE